MRTDFRTHHLNANEHNVDSTALLRQLRRLLNC